MILNTYNKSLIQAYIDGEPFDEGRKQIEAVPQDIEETLVNLVRDFIEKAEAYMADNREFVYNQGGRLCNGAVSLPNRDNEDEGIYRVEIVLTDNFGSTISAHGITIAEAYSRFLIGGVNEIEDVHSNVTGVKSILQISDLVAILEMVVSEWES